MNGLVDWGCEAGSSLSTRRSEDATPNWGASSTMMNIAAFGAAEKFDRAEFTGVKGEKPIYRSGGIAKLVGGTGVNWGKTAWANGGSDSDFAHEGTHYEQQKLLGFANFYGRVIKEYSYYLITTGNTGGAYNINAGTLDAGAMRIQMRYDNLKAFMRW